MKEREMVEIMVAFAKGAEIECRSDWNWDVVENPTWNWNAFTYRIKKLDIKDMAEIMIAFADGARIQYRFKDRTYNNDPWDSTSRPEWNWERFEYRVAT